MVSGGYLCVECYEATDQINPITNTPYAEETQKPGRASTEVLGHLEMQLAGRVDRWFSCPCKTFSSLIGPHKIHEIDAHILSCKRYHSTKEECEKTIDVLLLRFEEEKDKSARLETELHDMRKKLDVLRREGSSYREKYEALRDATQSMQSMARKMTSTAETVMSRMTPPRPPLVSVYERRPRRDAVTGQRPDIFDFV